LEKGKGVLREVSLGIEEERSGSGYYGAQSRGDVRGSVPEKRRAVSKAQVEFVAEVVVIEEEDITNTIELAVVAGAGHRDGERIDKRGGKDAIEALQAALGKAKIRDTKVEGLKSYGKIGEGLWVKPTGERAGEQEGIEKPLGIGGVLAQFYRLGQSLDGLFSFPLLGQKETQPLERFFR
jgi:hypothetical protein